jgi:hypothetical protein
MIKSKNILCISLIALSSVMSVNSFADTKSETTPITKEIKSVTIKNKAPAEQQLKENSLQMYNFKLKQKVVIDNPSLLSIEKGEEFIPQLEESVAIYKHFTGNGVPPIDAIRKTSLALMEIIKKIESEKHTKK